MLHSVLPYVYLTCSLTLYKAYYSRNVCNIVLASENDSDFSLGDSDRRCS